MSPVAAALALLAAANPFDLPPLPRPDEGYGALFTWLRTVNSALSIPDTEFRWLFGGFSVPILLAFEVAGVRKDWTVYPFLLPFWLVFGGVAFGLVGGLAATAAHLVLFPIGRLWFALRERRRAGGAEAPLPGSSVGPAPPPSPPSPPAPRALQDALRAAVDALRAAALDERERLRGGKGAPGTPAEPTWAAVRRAIGAALAAAPRPRPRDAAAPSPRDPGIRPPDAAGGPHGDPELGRFRPDPSRFRRRPPRS